MDLKQLRYLVAVADAGSFSAGARRAFVTQPTLSAAIAGLESELGARLFERLPRGVQATPAGARVLLHARAALREVAAIREAREPGPRSGRKLRIGLLPSLPGELVAQTLAKLAWLRPDLHWTAEDAPKDSLRKRLASGRFDLIFTSLDSKPAPGLRQLELREDWQVLAFPAPTRLAGRVTPQVLHGKPLVVRTHCELLQAASRILDEWRVVPQVVAKTDSDARAMEMVAAGIGACLVPDSLAHPAVRLVRVDGVRLRRRLGLEWVKGAADGAFDALSARM